MTKAKVKIKVSAPVEHVAEPAAGNCGVCGNPRGANEGIPVIKYRDELEEEPKSPYIAGYKKCDDPCHLVK